MPPEPEPHIIQSARKHGISDEDILHAYRTQFDWFYLKNEVTIITGYSTGMEVLEIGFVPGNNSTPDRVIDLIIHAMKARPRFLR